MTSGISAVMPGEVNYHKGPRQAGIIFDAQDHRPERGFAGAYIIETASSYPLGGAQSGRTSSA